MKLRIFIFMLASIMLSGCSGVRFAQAPVNTVMPESFTNRSTYPSAVAAYEFQELVGSIISTEPGKDLIRVGVVRAAASVPASIPVTDSLNYYHSRIQQGASAKGGYLAFAVNLSADAMVDLELDDIARATTDYNEEVIAKLNDWVKNHPRPTADTKRVWVKSVVLTRQLLTNYVKIDANASGQVGEVTGVKTGIYRKSDNTTRSTIIGLETFDVDQLANSFQQTSGKITPQLERARKIETYRGKSIIFN